MKIYYLGTCSGTEPMPNMHHTSLVIETNGSMYWFDAGEGCVHRAYTSGMDILSTKAIFISHPHIDHVGGLANLLFCINKLGSIHEMPLKHGNALDIFLPSEKVLGAVKCILTAGIDSKKLTFSLREHGVSDGVIYDDGAMRVSAIHNRHLGEDGSNGWHSYSYMIEAEGKRVIYSGDVKEISELDGFAPLGCDLLIMETGHHRVCDVCEYAISGGIKRLRFNHHGRQILNDRATAENTVSDYSAKSGIDMKLCFDGMTENI